MSARQIAVAALATLLFLFAGLWPDPARACSLLSVAWSQEESIRTSIHYWMGSAVVGSMCIGAGVYRGRWVPTLIVVAIALLFHPWWTLPPLFGPDCTFANVEASEWLFASLGILLSYHLFRIYRERGRSLSSS